MSDAEETPVGPCLDDERLQALVERRVAPGPELERAHRHVETCARCLDVLSALLHADEPTPPPRLAARAGSAPGVLTPGQVLGRYLVERPLGKGAMGEVYAAQDTRLRRKVALKLLRGEVARSASAEQLHARMWREAEALARLSHPNLVAVFDVVAAGERIAIAMEYVDGGSAREWVRAAPRTWREVLGVYLQAATGLAAAHRAGLVHRDFKPDNVLVSRDGAVRVSDFGLAVAAEPGPDPARGEVSLGSLDVELTATGEVLGTPAYMASDQLCGAAATTASDQFSFAVALWEALHGERPYAGATREALVKALRAGEVRPPPKGTSVPRSVRRVILRSLSPRPADRHPSMDAMIAALERAARWTARRTAATTLGALLGLALLATILRGPPPRECPPPDPMLAGIWDVPQRTAVHAALTGRGGAAAAALEARVEHGVSAWLEGWRATYRQTCTEVYVEKRWPERVFFTRLTCLQRATDVARRSVDALSATKDDADASVAKLEAELPKVEDCTTDR